MEVNVSKKDVLSGYIAQVFQYGTGLIVLPVILNHLSAEEIGMNYVMLTVGALANMADFGFSGQIGRNVTYVLSGSQKIYRDQLETIEKTETVNYRLLKIIIDASKFLYRRISLGVLFLLFTLGTLYMYKVTAGFSNVPNSLPIWIVYSIGTYFNIYFLYYSSLLSGAGKIKEQRFATIFSRIVYIIICFIMIFSGFGLLSVVVANLISPFVARYYSYKNFYSGEIKEHLPSEQSEKDDVRQAISDIWFTAKKSGTNTIGHYIGQNASTFIAGLFLPLAVTAQWGLLVQLMAIVEGVAMNMGVSYYPEYCKMRLRGEKKELIKKSSFSITSMILILIVGGLAVSFIGPISLTIIKSKTVLPVLFFMLAYVIKQIITCNAQLFAMLMTSRNVIPSPTAVLITSVSQVLVITILLNFTNLGIWALLLGPFIPGISYTLWAWMKKELDDMNISAPRFYYTGLVEIVNFSRRMFTTKK